MRWSCFWVPAAMLAAVASLASAGGPVAGAPHEPNASRGEATSVAELIDRQSEMPGHMGHPGFRDHPGLMADHPGFPDHPGLMPGPMPHLPTGVDDLGGTAPLGAGPPCEPRWMSTGVRPGMDSYFDLEPVHVFAVTTWDPDGAGPLQAQVVTGGRFFDAGGQRVNNIASWDGTEWRPLGAGLGFFGYVYALTTWDPDGAGPLAAQLVAGGLFNTGGEQPALCIARWDGTDWRPFGAGFDQTVYALTTWDPDGDGPLAPQLVAGGAFDSGVARWDGVEWLPFGPESLRRAYALTTWDPDGAGPLAAQLVAGGGFNFNGMPEANFIARWDGTQWLPLGTGLSDSVLALTTCDPDGSGPQNATLVAGGWFASAGGQTTNFIAGWDGDQWHAFGSGLNPIVNSLTTWDPDGDGPEPRQLVAGGYFTNAGGQPANNIACWDGAQWHAFDTGMGGSTYPAVFALADWDPDGPGPLSAQVVAGGDFITASGRRVNRITSWDGAAWQPLGTGPNDYVLDFMSWDPDGDGPLASQLVAGGFFSSAGGRPVNRLARWDGTQWLSIFGTAMNRSVWELTTWDPDGMGPQTAQLVAGGAFTTAGGQPANRIARWDGTQWLPVGSGVDGVVYTLTTWDPDGMGPQTAQLVAGGGFTTAGGQTVNAISRWDGTQWLPFESGMRSGDRDGYIRALTTWDPDGPGPQTAQLVAGGYFTTAGGQTVNAISRWDGTQWLPFGSGMRFRGRENDAFVSALTIWDPDGPGPQIAQLVAGGFFTTAGEQTVNFIACWNGAQWLPFGSGMDGNVYALTMWDPDGAGPLVAQLVAGGDFYSGGGRRARGIARWDGTEWLPFGTGILFERDYAGVVHALASWDPDGDGPLAPQLAAGGLFTTAGDVPSGNAALWGGCPDAPAPCAGDADADRSVNFADITSVLVHFGNTGLPFSPGDATGDGVVDWGDIKSVLMSFGFPCP